MEARYWRRDRLEFAGSVALGSAISFLSSLSTALFLVKADQWGKDELAIAVRWSAVLAVGLLLILAAWRKSAFRLPVIPRFVVGIGLGILITALWALFARDQYGRAWSVYGAALVPCWLAGAPAGFLVAIRPRLKPDLWLAMLLATVALWSRFVALLYWPPA
jgi:hypothetical protein